MTTEPMWLVCNTVATQPDSLNATCSVCGVEVWATRGSVERARRENFRMICPVCFDKLDDPDVAGVMHHGKMLNAGEIQSFVEGFFAKMARHGRN
jgi:hypothetical protein